MTAYLDAAVDLFEAAEGALQDAIERAMHDGAKYLSLRWPKRTVGYEAGNGSWNLTVSSPVRIHNTGRWLDLSAEDATTLRADNSWRSIMVAMPPTIAEAQKIEGNMRRSYLLACGADAWFKGGVRVPQPKR